MQRAGNAVRTGAHLAMVWWVGSVLSGVQVLVLLAALFTGWAAFALVAAVVVPSAVGLLACVGLGARYRRPGSAGLRLHVERVGHDTRRTDFRGCPVPLGEPIHCSDDGDGRLLVVHGDGGDARRELRLRGGGLVHTVTFTDSAADLPAARRVLSTLRPASDAELAGLPERLSTRR